MNGSAEYITPQGLARLKKELDTLWEQERPAVVRTVHWAAGNGDRSENGDYIYGKKRLRQIDSRVRFLRKRLEILTVVDPAGQKNRDRVYFGATVTVATQSHPSRTVTLVGRDEIDTDKGHISMFSPIGRALMGKTVGAWVVVDTPSGEDEIEILDIAYP
ncbi:transcription elongation factor GreB [Varunaivibrio sulfuroxidans]|uniref:Transcription elongation factor GreB n=1 Tax=Varunaivibrio sulfuroxidans TaxID=1773489 RepID=A0A4R3J9E4_9PROT|nr:transcription elongation factor GreB [Varunaivibrio sulfuroxidans]TCS62127.1 transcription elongation factor GreB [Varunaivibrio sulfuroxidans]WES30559.1 transcription elongation factor GreB [Varunaivibrio sulfuroxidans]